MIVYLIHVGGKSIDFLEPLSAKKVDVCNITLRSWVEWSLCMGLVLPWFQKEALLASVL